ncbi:MAG: hypothetical protein A2029_05815 [Chloroflexi bacterium RBG_19FT_COMBO_47_9]|nr:MAG: hypothetical protein A2Y53_06130 [Chloroflexi bacterium RBG_16_47_49]OGO59981.1 MAG: hypothetical protein A2029_05815 [Chloroflexi bacterium RBG_19FT_COMBO_47_9]
MTEKQKWEDIFTLYKNYLCEDNPRVKELALSYNAEVSPEARAIHDEAIVIDACVWHLQNWNWHLAEAGATAILATVPDTYDNTGEALKHIIEYYALCHEIDEVVLVETADDIYNAKAAGKVGVIIGAQSCDFIHNPDIEESVEAFARLGLRVMTIAYNHRSFAADGCATGTDSGLTKEGKRMIRAMEKHGIMVDLSHVGTRSTLETMDFCQKPAVFTHSNAYQLYPHFRNVTDEQIKKCAEYGGVIGVSLYNVITWDGSDKFPTIDNIIDNIAYYADLVGIDHVGLGSDSGANPGTYPHRSCAYFGKLTRDTLGKDSLMYKSYEAGRGVLGYFIEGCESLANFPNITERMLRRGFSKQDIQKVQGGNWVRIFKDWWL